MNTWHHFILANMMQDSYCHCACPWQGTSEGDNTDSGFDNSCSRRSPCSACTCTPGPSSWTAWRNPVWHYSMKNEQNLDFGVHLAPLAADDAIVTTAGSVATDNTRLTTAKSGRVCILRFADKMSNVPKHAVCSATLHHTVYKKPAERKHSFV